MIDYGHFIGGKRVAGTSGPQAGRDAADGRHGARHGGAGFGSRAARGRRERQGGAAGLGGDQSAAPRARADEVPANWSTGSMTRWPTFWRAEHGKTIADAKGDIQRGLEVVEVCIGAPHMMKGEFTDGAGPGIDVYSMRQALGVVAGITPFNFPAMIPLWKIAPAIACGNAFILKPSERDPGVPLRIAELFIEAGLPAGILNVVNGDKEVVDAHPRRPGHQGHRLRRLDADRALHLFARHGAAASACSASAAPRTT